MTNKMVPFLIFCTCLAGSFFGLHSFCFAAWSIEVVDNNEPAGLDPSLVLDSSGNPHISYFDNDNKNLNYAFWNGSSWTIETVDSGGYIGEDSSLALDSNGNPHITYYDETNDYLKYAYYDSGQWTVQTLNTGGTVDDVSSMALDSNNYAHIVFFDGILSYLKYIYYNGSSWNIETIDSSGGSCRGNSLVMDHFDSPHVSFTDCNNFLRYAYKSGGIWNLETVFTGSTLPGYGGIFPEEPSISVDVYSYPYIAFLDSINGKLKFADRSSGAWVVETIDTVNTSPTSTSGISLAIDSNGYPHIAYHVMPGDYLKYATKSSGSWGTETVDSSGTTGLTPSIASDNNDYIHIGYLSQVPYVLKYATSKPKTTTTSTTATTTSTSAAGTTTTTSIAGGLSTTTTAGTTGNTAPTAGFFMNPTVGTTETKFILELSGTSDAEDILADLLVRIDWETDNAWDKSIAADTIAEHPYDADGIYTITIEVEDTGGLTSQSTQQVKVVTAVPGNTPPAAAFTISPSSGDTSTTFSFDASSSTDVEDPGTLEFLWDFDGDGIWDTPIDVSPISVWQYAASGTYTVTLEVIDSGGMSATATDVLTVSADPGDTTITTTVASGDGSNTAPNAVARVHPPEGPVDIEFDFNFEESIDAEDASEQLEGRWDFESDGEWDTEYSADKFFLHKFERPDLYQATLEVRDRGGLTAQDTVEVLVNESAGCVLDKLIGNDPDALAALRCFRDDKLAKNRLGRIIIKTYYRLNPQIEHLLENSPNTKALARICLQLILKDR